MPPLYIGVPNTQLRFSHFLKGGHLAAIHAVSSSLTHRVERPSLIGLGNFPAETSLKTVALCNPVIVATWSTSNNVKSLLFIVIALHSKIVLHQIERHHVSDPPV
jgi:hypothetical protein